MPARLILNADDFGLTPGVNRAIEELHQEGALTSATLMATGNAFDDAVRIARANPKLGVGCHIVLVDGLPVSPPEAVPSLLAADGKRFRSSLAEFVKDVILGRIDTIHIEREALAQIQKLQRAGIQVTHFDTHKHTHLFPQVAAPLLRAAEQASLGAVRNPFEPAWLRPLQHGGLLRRTQLRLLDRLRPAFERQLGPYRPTMRTTSGSLGVSTTGTLNARTLRELLEALMRATARDAGAPGDQPGHTPGSGPVYELVCHPGYSDSDLDLIPTRLRQERITEREALLDVIPGLLATQDAPQLMHFGHLG